MLIKLPNAVWVNPLSVQAVFATPDNVQVVLTTWNNFGNQSEIFTPSEGQTTEELRDSLAAEINEACHAE